MDFSKCKNEVELKAALEAFDRENPPEIQTSGCDLDVVRQRENAVMNRNKIHRSL